jgi:tRNA threonylcarbamoyladenosine biosynthesis protein TsaE
VISRIHKGNPNFIHIDAYRLLDSSLSNFTDLDFESYLLNSIFVIEWGAPFVATLTDQYLDIKITQGENENSRNLEVTVVGQRWQGFNL